VIDPSEDTEWDRENPDTPTLRQLYKLVAYMDKRLIEAERDIGELQETLAKCNSKSPVAVSGNDHSQADGATNDSSKSS
jgi:hypothetical protein